MKITFLAAVTLLFTGLSVSSYAAAAPKHKTMVHPMKHSATTTPMVHPAREDSTDKLNQQQLDQLKK